MIRSQSAGTSPVPAGRLQFVVRQAFAIRDFRLLCLGETVSLLGDQFYLLAMPWLVLQISGSPLAVGLVTAMIAVPRALLMLLAGALSDRLSPRTLMIVSNGARMLLVFGLALLTMGQLVEMWMLYLFAIAFGAGDAFYFPARGALVPRLIPESALLVGNATMQATNQLAMFAGPLLAGSAIAVLGRSQGAGPAGVAWGIGAAFALDGVAFLFSLILLVMMHSTGSQPRIASELRLPSLWSSVVEGIAAVKRDVFLRSAFLLIGAGNLLITGPLYVGMPVLVYTRYGGGAGALGLILGLFGAGSLIGVSLAAVGPTVSERCFVWVMGASCIVLGGGLVVLGMSHSIEPVGATAAVMGLAQGFLVVQFLTVLQRRTDPQMLGRTMSLLMFLVVGLSPLSSGVAGALLELTASRLLIFAGISLMLLVAGAFFSPSLRPHQDITRDDGRAGRLAGRKG